VGVLDGRVAVITRAGRGIGAAFARTVAREGAALVLNDLGASPDGLPFGVFATPMGA
jgi:NAD(P)-dependent dehydrogenase (short-subunit alcohol dehydrogenase family)